MDRGVQIVDQLGTDGGLGHHQFESGQRILRIPVEHRNKGPILTPGSSPESAIAREQLRPGGQGADGTLKKVADLSPD